jgi:hypothetical protein
MKKLGILSAVLALCASAALAAGQFPYYPQATATPSTGFAATYPLTGNELIPADTQLANGLMPQTEVISTGQLGAFAGGFNTSFRNVLVGGDFGTNPWQRSTSTASIANTLTYVADRWFALGGASSNITISKQTGASDITTGFAASMRFQRTAANANTAAVCVGQVVESANSTVFQGKTAVLSYWVKSGANFSAANAVFTPTIAYGTGSDESAANFMSGAWTGYTAPTAIYVDGVASTTGNTTASTTWTQHRQTVAIPATATQIGVKICFTPVGTAGANDWIEFGQIQLEASSQSASTAVQSVFEALPSSIVLERAQRYAYVLTEATLYAAAGSQATALAPCAAVDTTHTNCWIAFPTTMRSAPTMSYTAGFATPTSTTQATLGACSALASAQTVSGAINTTTGVLVNCTATTIPAAGVASFFYASSGTGKITASAEL